MLIKDLWAMKLMDKSEGDGSAVPGSGSGDAPAGDPAGDDAAAAADTAAGDDPAAAKPEGEADSAADPDKAALSDNEAKLLKDVMKQKNRVKTLEDQLKESGATKTELDNLKAVLGDATVDDVKAILKERADAETAKLEAKGEYTRIVERMREEQGKTVSALESRIAELETQLDEKIRSIDDMTVGRSFSESAYISEASVIPSSIARKEFGSHFELKDGQVVAYDKPAGQGERTLIVDANGNPKAFEAAIAELYGKHPDSARLIKATQKPGAKSNSDRATGKETPSTVTGKDRIRKGLGKL